MGGGNSRSALSAPEGGVINFGEGGPPLFVKVDVSGLSCGGADPVRAALGELFAGHPVGWSQDEEEGELQQQYSKWIASV